MFMIFLGPMLQCFLYRFEVGDEYLVWRVVERDLNEILLTWEFKGVKVCVPEQYILAFLSLFLWFYVPYRDSVQSCFGFSILSNQLCIYLFNLYLSRALLVRGCTSPTGITQLCLVSVFIIYIHIYIYTYINLSIYLGHYMVLRTLPE